MIKDIFLNNKYTRIYYQIIDRAKSRPKPNHYTEKHHIIPKCKPFCGLNISKNLVFLTFREHFICHHLLMKMVRGKFKSKMYWAFTRMGMKRKNQKRSINARMYERIKISNRHLHSGRNHWNYGKNTSEEVKKKISKTSKERKQSIEHINNMVNAKSQNWQIIYPNGKKEIIKNLSKFCRENNLQQSDMVRISQGKLKYHHKFKCIKMKNIKS